MTGKQRRRIRNGLIETGFVLLSLAILLPVALMVFGSLKSAPEAARLRLDLPDVWRFDNYALVFEKGKIGRAMLNSVMITFASVFGVVLVSAMAAFYIVRRDTGLNRVMLNVFYMGLVAPLHIITTIQLLQWLHLSGTYISVILIFIALHIPFSVFLFSGFIKTVPKELEEAAEIDGCGPFRLFFFVVFPLLLPVLATCSIINFMGIWNDFMIPLFFLNSSEKWTMPLTVYHFFGRYSSEWNLVFADLMITAAPVLLVYVFAQRFIIDGMTSGSVKG